MDRDQAEARLLKILTHHMGKDKAIDMGELYLQVFGENFMHKINGTRKLRKLISSLRWEGLPIGETRAKSGGGYFLARSATELSGYLSRRKQEALRKLAMVARIQKTSLAELLGQMSLELKGNGDAQSS